MKETEKVEFLRQKLGQKAKQEPKFRFYTLYDRIYRKDVLTVAWRRVKANRGSAGVDGITISDIESPPDGAKVLIQTLHDELREKRYRPQAIRRVYIPKANGKQRPLGIPAIRDRVVQMAALLILEPIFEADFLDVSHGFRPGRNCHGALKQIHQHLKDGYKEIYDADLQGYFDSIPHDKLMACIKMRVTDGQVLNLIRMWLKSQVVEKGKPPSGRPDKGVPQGGVISPLLSNLYLHWFDKMFYRQDGPANWAGAKLVRYADDFVVMARYQTRRIDAWINHTLEDWLGLTINREKTKVVKLSEPKTKLEFLGYHFRYDRSLVGRKGSKYLNVGPTNSSLKKERAALKELTSYRRCFIPAAEMISQVNRQISGWANYFNYGYSRKAFRSISWYARERVAKHLNRRSQRHHCIPEGKSMYAHLGDLGLINLPG